MQYSLFDAVPSSPLGHLNARLPRKLLTVRRVPRMNTIQNYCWGASHRASELSNDDLIKAWKYSFALQCYWRLNKRPVDYHERAHKHMITQIIDHDRLAVIENEMSIRGLMDKYELDVELPHHRQ